MRKYKLNNINGQSISAEERGVGPLTDPKPSTLGGVGALRQ